MPFSGAKVGQKVVVSLYSVDPEGEYIIYTVTRISPTGIITLSSGYKYRSDGSERTSDWRTSHLLDLDENTKKLVEQTKLRYESRRIISDLIHFNYTNMPIEYLREMNAILSKCKKAANDLELV
jgi:hypothetical protein